MGFLVGWLVGESRKKDFTVPVNRNPFPEWVKLSPIISTPMNEKGEALSLDEFSIIFNNMTKPQRKEYIKTLKGQAVDWKGSASVKSAWGLPTINIPNIKNGLIYFVGSRDTEAFNQISYGSIIRFIGNIDRVEYSFGQLNINIGNIQNIKH